MRQYTFGEWLWRGLVSFVLVVAGVLVRGLGTALMWNWFVAPLGAPQINWLWALGLGAAWHFMSMDFSQDWERLKKRKEEEREEEDEDFDPSERWFRGVGKNLAYIFVCLTATGIGWLVSLLM